ncbi:MAG: hypothetical protein KJT03_18085, partial [Verrucomicrobiae bacterium]|nr:hypothetical protein [Verrucomicrobiae bacterium]
MVSSRICSLRDPYIITAVAIIVAGVGLRIWAACATVLWIDEAESSINAFTILQTGLPVDHYLGEPIY